MYLNIWSWQASAAERKSNENLLIHTDCDKPEYSERRQAHMPAADRENLHQRRQSGVGICFITREFVCLYVWQSILYRVSFMAAGAKAGDKKGFGGLF